MWHTQMRWGEVLARQEAGKKLIRNPHPYNLTTTMICFLIYDPPFIHPFW